MLNPVHRLKLASFFLAWAIGWSQEPMQNGSFEGSPSIVVSNAKLQFTIMKQGSTVASITLTDDPEKLSPLWNPMRMARELGHPAAYNGGAGHFICVDGFGAPSPEEKAAGLPFHGEAHTETFAVHSARQGSSTVVTLTATLPITQEKFTRTFRIIDGENVVHVESDLDSLLGFDRPINWAEHATIGSPFLEPGVTVVDVSGSRSHTRAYTTVDNGDIQRRLKPDQDFQWPLAPGLNGTTVDLRQTPKNPHFLDHAATLTDPNREVEWVTAINPNKQLILGYLFRRADYPWVQHWGFYPPSQKMARGMEFSTQPFDLPRREVVTTGTMFGTPLYRWLPAKSSIKTRFLFFYAHVPSGFTKVDDIKVENGRILVIDHDLNEPLTLISAEGL